MAATDVMLDKPPRPPNSWILYRAYMMKKLQPKDSRERRLSQSEMSSLIASMWRNATAETKREFEEMAERLKLEHQAKYPGYKYQPRKKEEKERAKELQKQQRQAQKRDMRSKRGVSGSSAALPPPPIQPMVNPYFNPHILSFSAALSPPLSAASSPAGNDPLNSPKPLLLNMLSVVASPTAPVSALPEMPQAQMAAIPALLRGVGSYLPSPLPTPLDPATYHPLSTPTPVPTEVASQIPGPVWQPLVPNVVQTDDDSSSVSPHCIHFTRIHLTTLQNTLSFEVNNWIFDPELASFLSTSTPGMFQIQGLDQAELDQQPELELSIPDLNISQDVTTFLKAAFFEKDSMPGPSSMGGSLLTDVSSNNDQFDFSSLLNPYPLESADTALSFFDCSYNLNGQSNSYSEHFSPIEPAVSRSASETISHLSSSQPLLHSSEPSSSIPSSSSQTYIPPSGAIHSSTRRVAGKWSLPTFISASSQV